MGNADDDPVRQGLVVSLGAAWGECHRFSPTSVPTCAGKRLEILKETIPKASRVAIVWDPRGPARYRARYRDQVYCPVIRCDSFSPSKCEFLRMWRMHSTLQSKYVRMHSL